MKPPTLLALLALGLPLGLLAAGESWNNPPGGLPAGAEHKTFMSASMKTEVGYNIYLPPGYAADKATRWPVLYYLHGRGGTESSHTGAFAQFDQAIKDKKIPPFIYVHAMCGRNSGYVDAVDGSVMGETVFIKELIPHIDATYRTVAAKGGRAVEGFSKGGQGALLFAFKFPELFSSCIG
jgi:endo-1,4-beta-xylanase